MHAIVRLIDRISGATGLIGGWLVAPLIIAGCYEVIARYVFGNPTVWAFELGYMLTGANFLLGMAFALREKAHIRIEVFYQFFSPRAKAVIDGLTYALIAVPLCSWLAFGLYEYALDAYLSSESSGMSAWNPLVWPFRVTFALGFAVFALQALSELIKVAHTLRHGVAEEPAKEPASGSAHSMESA